MDINNMDFINLLPIFMKTDDANIGLSNAVNIITENLAEKGALCSTWDKVDNMSGPELDLLAEELNITWYDKDAALDIKRQIVKDSDKVHSKLGTNWAVLRVIETYFGEGKIIDWYEYDGEPYHFKVQTINQSILNTKAEAFMKILNVVKRKSAVLDSIELIAEGICNINTYVKNVHVDILSTVVRR